MNDYTTRRNVLLAAILQLVSLINGFVILKIILSFFGAEVHGLVSSLTQFLGFISLLEGGVSGVTMAALYRPLKDHDDKKISGILKATQLFFKKIALIYVVYAISLSVIYPIVVNTSFNWWYICSLTLIIAATTFIQYYFALALRILLNADRKGYIVSATQLIMVLLNLGLTILCAWVIPEIHVLKIINVIGYIIQPVIFSRYVKKNYKLDFKVEPDKKALMQKWDGFGQNLAYFIHTNTDVVILSFFSTLQNVSIYSVYAMISNALKNFCISVSSAIAPSMGNALVQSDKNIKLKTFEEYSFFVGMMSTFMFTCGIVLVTPFVILYTRNVTGVNYDEPIFAILIMLSEAVYCFRDPYVQVVYGAGHFKQTAKFAYIEAIMNIIISLCLVNKLGLLGIALGTFISMLFRMIAHVFYLRSHILNRPISAWIRQFASSSFIVVISMVVTNPFRTIAAGSYVRWIICAVAFAIIILIIMQLIYWALYREQMSKLYHLIWGRIRGLKQR